MTETFPEFYQIILIASKEMVKFTEYGYNMNLERMCQRIKNFLGCVNRIGNNDNFGNIAFGRGLVDTAPNCKELSFGTSDKGHIMKSFDKRTVNYVCVQNGCSNVILDASICYNDGCRVREE